MSTPKPTATSISSSPIPWTTPPTCSCPGSPRCTSSASLTAASGRPNPAMPHPEDERMTMTARPAVLVASGLLLIAPPASAQEDLTGSYQTRMYEDYIERGPGEFMGNFTGMPLTDE